MTAAIIAAAIGGFVQGVSGFAFGLIAAPVFIAVTSPEQSVSGIVVLGTVVLLPALVRPAVVRREAVGLTAWALPGLVAGGFALRYAPELVLRIALAAGVLAAVALRLRHGAVQLRASMPVAGLTAGVLTTSIGGSGPPMVLHLMQSRLSPAQIRGTLAVTFTALNAAAFAVLSIGGTFELPPRFGVLALVTVVGAVSGRLLAGELDGETFERIVMVLLIASAASALVTA